MVRTSPADDAMDRTWPADEAPDVADRSMRPGVWTSEPSMEARTVLARVLTAIAAPIAGLMIAPTTDAPRARARPPASAWIVERSRAVRLTSAPAVTTLLSAMNASTPMETALTVAAAAPATLARAVTRPPCTATAPASDSVSTGVREKALRNTARPASTFEEAMRARTAAPPCLPIWLSEYEVPSDPATPAAG